MTGDIVTKAAVSVTEMAKMTGLSRDRAPEPVSAVGGGPQLPSPPVFDTHPALPLPAR